MICSHLATCISFNAILRINNFYKGIKVSTYHSYVDDIIHILVFFIRVQIQLSISYQYALCLGEW